MSRAIGGPLGHDPTAFDRLLITLLGGVRVGFDAEPPEPGGELSGGQSVGIVDDPVDDDPGGGLIEM
jgi:hypothetical protein